MVGAVMVACSCLPLLHLSIGVAMLSGVLPIEAAVEGDVEAMPSLFAWVFIGMGALFFLLRQAVSIGVVVSGRFLKKRKNDKFSFVMGCLMCFFVPVGTILGGVYHIVLSRDSVKMNYDRT